MDFLTIAMWVGTGIFLVISATKDRGKTKQALKMAFGMGKGMLGSILLIIFLIGLILTLFTAGNNCQLCRQTIASYIYYNFCSGGGHHTDTGIYRFPACRDSHERRRQHRSGCCFLNNADNGRHRDNSFGTAGVWYEVCIRQKRAQLHFCDSDRTDYRGGSMTILRKTKKKPPDRYCCRSIYCSADH